ncbi:MAG: hypothetical protein PHE15_04505 [Dehalococcoidales bacterium]|nr:hypothetical protein [Dehalococcoidales bacterium]
MHTHNDLEPSPFLIGNIALLPRGKALDIAMGSGRNALYPAKKGFDVEGVEYSTEAVKTALERAESTGIRIKT